jgi:cysteine desulfurase
MKPIYLDYAATTPVDARVAKAMADCLTYDGAFGNAASSHFYGAMAREKIETAREQVAAFLQADPAEIIWTSGATESDNLAIKGAIKLYQRKGKHIVTMKTEHKAVLDTCQYLEKHGFQVTYLAPQRNGLLDINEFEAALRPDTVLVSIMHVNNETGVIQPLEKIAAITSSRQILLHVDAAQSTGKIALNVAQLPIDLISLSAHKVYGPKGIGALYIRKKPRVRVEPLIHGGGHEQGMRSGTLPTHQVVGMGEAFAIAKQESHQDTLKIKQLRDSFVQRLNQITAMRLNVDGQHSVPHIVNLRFENMISDAILAQLPGIAASTASACQGKGTEGSYVLRAMGLTQVEVKSSIRFSLGKYLTQADMDQAASEIQALFAK